MLNSDFLLVEVVKEQLNFEKLPRKKRKGD